MPPFSFLSKSSLTKLLRFPSQQLISIPSPKVPDMTWLSRFNPTPGFPGYTGPYKVGSTDIEIPASELESPGPSPSPCTNLPTVAFRVFYPCQQESEQRGVRWIPSPQREYVGAYARFLGANSAFSQVFSVIPQLLYYISIPVHHNAEILEPPTSLKRWPVMVFSHGLGGSRNAYSHICGSLASHGVVVVAPDHRDGSSPISFIHTPDAQEKLKRVEYKRVPHKASTEVYESRDEQLRIRMWELGLIHDALLKIDKRVALSNVSEDHGKPSTLIMLANKLNVHEPGSISWAGHSFGAATMVQFVKSVFYQPESPVAGYRPLFTPSSTSSIVRQITPSSAVTLLDLWTLPIQSPGTSWLKAKPMPCYKSDKGGSNLLAILSEAFYKWSANFQETKSVIAQPVGAPSGQAAAHIFYPISSAHLSQSDFGVLFPWVTTKVFGAKDPERVLRLNTRAILQVLRNGGVEVANTSIADLEIGTENATKTDASRDDRILSTLQDSVQDWVSLSADDGNTKTTTTEKGPGEAVYEGEVLGEVFGQGQR